MVEGFVCKEQDFKLKAVGDREPVEILKDKGDVVRKADVGEEVCSRALGLLEFIEGFGRCCTAVIKSGCNEGLKREFLPQKKGGTGWRWVMFLRVKKAAFGELDDVHIELEATVQDITLVGSAETTTVDDSTEEVQIYDEQ